MKTLGHLIRDRRKELGWSQDDLADDVGVSRGYIAKIETDAQTPGIKVLNDLAEELEIPKEKLFQYCEKTRPLVSTINQSTEYDKRWAKLSNVMKNRLLEMVQFLEDFSE